MRCNITFLGLGAIGAPMAAHLAKTFDLTVWNRTHATAKDFAKHKSCQVAQSVAEAVQHADVIITCLPSSVEVEAIVDGADGIAAHARPGSVLVDCTSGHPTTSVAIAKLLATKGIEFMDAPVSGGVTGAEQGILTVMCGGSPEIFERVQPILRTFGEKIVHCGAIGSGHAIKAVNNALLASHILATAEGLALLVKMGIDPALALDVINTSSGRSNASMNLFPERVLTRAFPNTFRLALLDKDAGIASSLAASAGTPAPLLELTTTLYHEARAELGEAADHVEAVKMVERKSGVTIILSSDDSTH